MSNFVEIKWSKKLYWANFCQCKHQDIKREKEKRKIYKKESYLEKGGERRISFFFSERPAESRFRFTQFSLININWALLGNAGTRIIKKEKNIYQQAKSVAEKKSWPFPLISKEEKYFHSFACVLYWISIESQSRNLATPNGLSENAEPPASRQLPERSSGSIERTLASRISPGH